MSAANATMSLVRTIGAQATRQCQARLNACRRFTGGDSRRWTTYGSRQLIVPVWQLCRESQVPRERSHRRPLTYGPRSMTRTVTMRPLAGLRRVTRVPHGSDRWATPMIDRE